jgi:hypothetical protein
MAERIPPDRRITVTAPVDHPVGNLEITYSSRGVRVRVLDGPRVGVSAVIHRRPQTWIDVTPLEDAS